MGVVTGRAYVSTLAFLGTWLGYCDMSTTLIWVFRGPSKKWWPA